MPNPRQASGALDSGGLLTPLTMGVFKPLGAATKWSYSNMQCVRMASASLPLLNLCWVKALGFPRGAGRDMVCGPRTGGVRNSSVRPARLGTMYHPISRRCQGVSQGHWGPFWMAPHTSHENHLQDMILHMDMVQRTAPVARSETRPLAPNSFGFP